MLTLAQSGVSIGDAVVALYIGADGSLLASEKISGARTIESNQLEGLAPPSDATEIIACEISVGYRMRDAGCGRDLKYVLTRICYDRFGNRVPCF